MSKLLASCDIFLKFKPQAEPLTYKIMSDEQLHLYCTRVLFPLPLYIYTSL